MAHDYYADNYRVPPPSGHGGYTQAAPFKFTVSTALIVNDTIKLVQLASGGSPGFNLFGIQIWIPDLDSSSSLVFQLGDSTAADRYVTTTLAAALGQTAGAISSFGPSIPYAASTADAGVVFQSLPARYDDTDNLILKVQTAPGTGLTSVAITGYILYSQLGTSPFTAV